MIQSVLLPFIGMKAKWYFLREEWKVRARFYSDPQFRDQDKALKKAYRFSNPYRMNKRFLHRLGHTDLDTYGETPLTTLDTMVRECAITAQDSLVELGCGRGRGVFFLSHRTGCSARGIDWNPEFIARAKKADLGRARTKFLCDDILNADLSTATVVYLFGTCLPDEVIERLVERFSQLSPSIRIITVSFPLSDYSSRFRIVKEFLGEFPWGKTSLYVNAHILK